LPDDALIIKNMQAAGKSVSEIVPPYLTGMLAVERAYQHHPGTLVFDRWLPDLLAMAKANEKLLGGPAVDAPLETITPPHAVIYLECEEQMRVERIRARGVLSDFDALSLHPQTGAIFKEHAFTCLERMGYSPRDIQFFDTSKLNEAELLEQVAHDVQHTLPAPTAAALARDFSYNRR
jgi:hypothetical protein